VPVLRRSVYASFLVVVIVAEQAALLILVAVTVAGAAVAAVIHQVGWGSFDSLSGTVCAFHCKLIANLLRKEAESAHPGLAK
jgi:hypothetical protein